MPDWEEKNDEARERKTALLSGGKHAESGMRVGHMLSRKGGKKSNKPENLCNWSQTQENFSNLQGRRVISVKS